ncbi:C-C motif chemokine 21a-like isoform X2 [Protopterus annectens]|uniref:C-C motif chemokine 21a-like isoform X2 n=1 Tax=Protopterus annectens TaxID=7888 RepID=UPI001CFBBBA0|nr:C-C motif chemokine 21a-like isoform X2 [Protopterus annectens]
MGMESKPVSSNLKHLKGSSLTALDCCISTGRKHIKQSSVKSYTLQTTDSGCTIPAVRFTFKKGATVVCAPPEEPWVKDLMNKLDRRQKDSTENEGGTRKGKSRKKKKPNKKSKQRSQ